jgi:hypothetical protein
MEEMMTDNLKRRHFVIDADVEVREGERERGREGERERGREGERERGREGERERGREGERH